MWGLTKFDTVKITKKNEIFASLDTWLGKKEKVGVYVKDDIYVTVKRRKKNTISAYIEYDGPALAPIEKDAKLGELSVFINDELLSKHGVFAIEKINKVNIFSKIINSYIF